MAKSSADDQLGIVRSVAVISLGLVALAGSIAASLCRRILTSPATAGPATPPISKLVVDEWEADLSRLNLPSRRDVVTLQQQIAELEAQIDQIIQRASQPEKED
jgi:hypothetical protein